MGTQAEELAKQVLQEHLKEAFLETARIWDAATATEIAVLRGPDRHVNSAAFNPEGVVHRYAEPLAGEDGSVRNAQSSVSVGSAHARHSQEGNFRSICRILARKLAEPHKHLDTARTDFITP